MALPEFLKREVDIAGRKVPVWVLLGLGGGVVLLLLVARGGGEGGPKENPIDVARQLEEQVNKMTAPPPSGESGASGAPMNTPDLSSTLAAWSAGFGKELSGALAAQSAANQEAVTALQKELSQFKASASMGTGSSIPSFFPQPMAAAGPAYIPPATPYIEQAAPYQTPTPVAAPKPTSATKKIGTAGVSVGVPLTSSYVGPQENPELSAYNRYRSQTASIGTAGGGGGGSSGAGYAPPPIQEDRATRSAAVNIGTAGVNVGSGGSFSSYTVRSGDALYKISRAYGVSLQNLLSANPQITNPNLIRVGQVIRIPT